MVERRELITICRQIGTMMEVGVDFLRLTRALREQTDNPRLLELYDQIEHDMRMGENLADSIAKAPDVFSPFAVSLIRQGEARGDVEGAWHRLADSLKQEAQEDKDLGLELAESAGTETPRVAATPRGATPIIVGEPAWISRLERASRRVLLGAATFLATICALWSGAQAGAISWSAMVPLQLFLAALWLFTMALWPRSQGSKSALTLPATMPDSVPLAAPDALSQSSPTFASPTFASETRAVETRTEELLRNFAPTFPVVEEPAGEPDFGDDPDTPPPHSEKRFQL